MAERTEESFVRCPKCGSLLRELPGVSVYRCGGCDAVLRAKRNGSLDDVLSEVSEDVKGGRGEEVSTLRGSEVVKESGDGVENSGVGRDVSFDSEYGKRGKERMRRLQTFDDGELNVGRPEYGNAARLRNRDFRYHDEGQSRYDKNLNHEQRCVNHSFDELASIGNLGNGQAEFLRKLDELKDRFTRSCEMTGGKLDGNDHRIPYSYNMHPSRGPDEFLHYPEMIRGPTRQWQTKYREQLCCDRIPGYYGDVNADLFMLHRYENFFHQPACSCVHCIEKNWRMPPGVDHLGFQNQRSQNGPSNPSFHQNLTPVLHQPNDLDSENGLGYHRPRNFAVAHRRARLRYPVAGGAPFMTCDNCFELLKLSRKHITLAKRQQKAKCGACSSIILFDVGKPTSFSNIRDDPRHGCAAAEKGSISGGSERQWEPHSSASSLHNEVESPEKVASAESPGTEADVFQLPNHSPENKEVRRFDSADKSRRAEEEVSFRTTNGRDQEHSVGNTTVATEISVNGLSNSYISHDSVETNEGEPLKANKGGVSFFGALIKKGFRDFTKSNRATDVTESQVYVNGHLIPDLEVKKAEKLAGPIQPGDYWYDKKAGFWGVMGHPCMGIIMPNIEEFKHPLPKNCAAGDTGVFVNGRELYHRDLDLLAKRGLPVTKNRSYLVQITGEVIDEQTGEELDGLGKLAPTVERAQHGFGMKVPRFLAQSRS